jgi:hypothetical protein
MAENADLYHAVAMWWSQENKSFVLQVHTRSGAPPCEACRAKSFVSNQYGRGVIKVYSTSSQHGLPHVINTTTCLLFGKTIA